ncbi:hypothetical protein OESDEN_01010 [Oesophagostomum dentatum]|uniref:Glycosyltransferase family 92 protein n=1 Tax=Oesophagostomum dentatum TaxID=61180 RepID=A0A0B1TU73_OESDE|nr:hypothetical protein OESDEN_01010 [Oesophagostomum dentatum]
MYNSLFFKTDTTVLAKAAPTTFTSSIPSTSKRAFGKKRPRDIKACIPFYDFIAKQLENETGIEKVPKTSFSLISAYAYAEYSVVTIEARGYWGLTMYCRYFDRDWKELESPVESVVFPAYAIHCCRHPEAAYMSITGTMDGAVDSLVPVLDRTVDDPQYNLSLCLAPMYGDESKWLLLAELIEHYKLQGVQHFYLYIKDIDAYSRKLIDDYVKTGEAEAVYFREERDRPGKEWQLVGVTDCVQRSRHHSRYVIFCDLDERLLTFNNKTLPQQAMTDDPDIASVQFKTRWILRTHKPPSQYEGDETLHNHLPTLVFHNTSAIAPFGHTGKCVVDTRRVLIMSVHYPLLLFPGYEEAFAEEENAYIRITELDCIVLRHYRGQYGDSWAKRWIHQVERFGNFTMTDYPEHLMAPLYENIKQRLTQVYRKS